MTPMARTRQAQGAPYTGAPGRWTVVLPVKGGADAKSRLVHPARSDLAGAIALDTVDAVLGAGLVHRVLVVTADPRVRSAHTALGAEVVQDPGQGLAGAVAAGLAAAGPGACALLLADLPSLRAADVDDVLDACGRAFAVGAQQVTVPDADGTGTVMLAAATPGRLRPRFGPGSAAAHARDAVVLLAAPARLRRDVDTVAHLAEAERSGVGPRTAAVLSEGGAAWPQPRSTMAPREASLSPKRS